MILRIRTEEIFCSTPDKEVFYTKSAKKILALILAGVMALALLTGCGKSTSLNRAMAEGMAEYFESELAEKGNTNNISVSYQVPELSREIAPLFDTNWMDAENGYLDETAFISGTTTVKLALQQHLRNYEGASCTVFFAKDVTECAGSEVTQLITQSAPVAVYGNYNTALQNATHLRIAVTHKTINDRTYALAVIIFEK